MIVHRAGMTTIIFQHVHAMISTAAPMGARL